MDQGTQQDNSALFEDLVKIMARLRGPDGCPWDREQDHRTLRPCLLEETYEVLDAIDRGDDEGLREELGDLLLQVVFHAQLASETKAFAIEDVIAGLRDKLIERHPHVFGEASAETPQEVLHQWDALKRQEKNGQERDPVTDVPAALPALSRAQVVLRRAARAGIASSAEEARATAKEALAALTDSSAAARDADSAVGEMLLAVVDIARSEGVDAEQALRERVVRLMEEVRTRARTPDGAAVRNRAGPG
jgi:tetrapyrrole methylase family protein/MazG family protein